MNKPVTEQELIEKSAGERVTLEAVNAAIISEHYFTASQGDQQSNQDYASTSGQNAIKGTPADLALLTICVLRLWNGFTVLGQSACADPANFNAEIGQRLARTDAVNKMWALMGYELKSRIARDQKLLEGAIAPGPNMHTYIGTKVINAKVMSRLEYNFLRGWQLPADEDGDDIGYLVEYADPRDKPNTDIFKGYVSWSPKDVFERAYRPVRAAEAQPAAASAEGSGTASQTSGTKPLIVILDEEEDAEPFLVAYVTEDAKEVGIEHDTDADWHAIYRAHVALRDRLNERLADKDLCPFKPAEEASKPEDAKMVWGTWLDRTKLELSQLTERYEKLEAFLRTEDFHRLPAADRKDLYVQVNNMEGYKHALAKRVARAEAVALIGKPAAEEMKVDW